MNHYSQEVSNRTKITQAKKRRIWDTSSQHTLDHRDCPACKAANERVMQIDRAIATMLFPQAAERWLEWRRPYVEPSTITSYQGYFSAVYRFFGLLRLEEITPGHLREYQRLREVNADARWVRTAQPMAINHELNAVSQVLEYAGLWQKMKPYYRPLRLRRWNPPRVMTPEEERRLFEVASSNIDFELAYLAASITNNTSASGCELRGLQIMHVKLNAPIPEVLIPSDRAKNEHRGRRIPLNPRAAVQFERCLLRAAKLGSVNQDHYLFPFRVKRNCYDPTRPASRYWIRAQFEKMRAAADLPWLRPHDLRHQAITRMLETGAPEMTIMSIAGHVSKQMLNHYSHIRMDAKLAVVMAVEPSNFQVAHMRRVS